MSKKISLDSSVIKPQIYFMYRHFIYHENINLLQGIGRKKRV
jgi:hypothetical protein